MFYLLIGISLIWPILIFGIYSLSNKDPKAPTSQKFWK